MNLYISEYNLNLNRQNAEFKQKKTVKFNPYFDGQISQSEPAKVNSGMAKSYFGITSFKGVKKAQPFTMKELSKMKNEDGHERFNQYEKIMLIDLSKEEPEAVRKLTSLEKNGAPLLYAHHIELLVPIYKKHPEEVEALLNMEDSKKIPRWSAFDTYFLLDTYLKYPNAVNELSKFETEEGYLKFSSGDVQIFAEDYEENPNFVEKYDMFNHLNKKHDLRNTDIKYAIRLSNNPETENFIIDNFDDIKEISSMSSDNFIEIDMDGVKIHTQTSDGKHFQITGAEVQLEEDKITRTVLRKNDGSVKKEEYSKKGTEKNQGYLETIQDKDGKIISRTLTKPSKRNPGVLVVLRENLDKDGNLINIQQIGTVKNFGEKGDRKRIERNFVSPSGTKSRQLILEIPNGRRMEYKIGDKTFSRVSKKTGENTTETYVWGNKYTTKYNQNCIEVSAQKKDGRTERYVLNDKQLNFFMMPVYKQLPDDYLYVMAKFGTKADITDSEIWKNNACYGSNDNKIEISLERAEDPFTFSHEIGHMIDELPFRNLNSDEKLKEVFNKELDAYKKQATELNEKQIIYFTAKNHTNMHGCLSEVIAESVASLSGLHHSEDHLLLRAKILQENFPETIGYIGSKMQLLMENI
ncbi:hypothetical protein IJI31_00175 [bacterium]|nr:hypothetical protein [bacterium]